MRGTHYLVIMGAAVWPGGCPSDAMRRRVEAAIAGRRSLGNASVRFLPTGGVGRHPPSEAAVMRDLLMEHGVSPGCILLEERGNDTLSSVIRCVAILRDAGDVASVTICSDGYHLPRCRLLFGVLGVPACGRAARPSRAPLGWRHRVWLRMREWVAMPWDALLAFGHRVAGS